jgi:hypothetical protein
MDIEIDFNKGSLEWLSENGGRAVFTLEDLTATDKTVIPHDSILYVCGACSSNDRLDSITLADIQDSNNPRRTVVVSVDSLGTVWDWNHSDKKTQVVATQLLKVCRDICIAAFEAPDEESKKELLLGVYRNLQYAIGVDEQLDNPIVKYARAKWPF